MKRIVLFFLLLSPVWGRSQAEIKIDGIGIILAPPVLSPSVSEVKITDVLVRNYAPAFQFQDSLRINIGVVDSLNQLQLMDQYNGGYQELVEAGLGVDSVKLDTVLVHVNPSYFREGNNTVVIWPAAPGTYTLDSLQLMVNYSSVDDLDASNIDIKIGPNPATEHLYLGDPGNLVQQVRIRTLDGKLLYNGTTNKTLYLGALNNGIYVVELQTKQKVYTRKLIIQR